MRALRSYLPAAVVSRQFTFVSISISLLSSFFTFSLLKSKSSSVFFAFVEQNGQVGEEKTFDVKNARRLFGIPKRGR